MDSEQGEQLEVGEVEAQEPEIIFIDEKRPKFSDASKLQVQRMVDLMAGGTAISEAASRVGTDIETVMSDSKARKALAEVLKEYSLTNEEIRGLIKAKGVQIALEGEDDKAKLAALKLLAGVPGVDLLPSAKTQVNVGVGVFSEETQRVLDGLD
jgi:hypothetical protein